MKKLTLLVDIPRVQEFTCMQGWMNQFGKNLSNIWNLIPFCLIRTLWRKEIGTLLKIRKARDSVVNQQILLVHYISGLYKWDFTNSDSMPFCRLLFQFKKKKKKKTILTYRPKKTVHMHAQMHQKRGKTQINTNFLSLQRNY